MFRRHPGFGRLWAAGAVSLCGDWLSFVAVSVLALTQGGGPFALALVFAAHAMPGALLAPVAGAFVDRIDRRKVLVTVDVLAALVTAGMALMAALGWFVGVQLLLLVRSAITSAVPPAESAAVRRLVGPADRVAANAILAATWSVAYIAGMALGGAAALLGPTLALVLDAGSFALAAAIHTTLPPLPVARAPSTLREVVISVPRDTVLALRHAAGHRALLSAVLAKTPLGLGAGAGWIALNLIGAEAQPFGAAALSFGVLQAIRGAGTGIGPLGATWLAKRGVSAATLQNLSRALLLVALAWLTVARDPVSLTAVTLLWGIGVGTNWVMAHTELQRHATDLVIGRLAAFDELLVATGMSVAALVGAWAAVASGAGAAALAGVALGMVGLAIAALVIARVTRPDAPPPAAADAEIA